jgi:uncharacterized protein
VTAAVDANIIIYASDDASPLQERATRFLEQVGSGPELVYVFWPTAMAYLRVVTHPSIFRHPLPYVDALGNVDDLLALPSIRTAGERERFWREYREVHLDAMPAGNLVSDAHLVALMRENGVRTMWSHDRDFRRFPSIRLRDPFDPRDAS